MRRALRAYRVISSAAFGILVIAALLAAGTHLIAPAASREIWIKAIARLAREDSSGLKGIPDASRPEAAASTPGSAVGTAFATMRGDSTSSREAARHPSRSSQDEIDVLALETRLRHLEGALACDSGPNSGGMLEASVLEKLAAWESLRAPLLELLGFLGAARPEGETEAQLASGPIESVAPRISQKLRELCRESRDSRGRIVEGLMAPTIARLLLDDRTITDDRALGLLRRVNVNVARETVERLARRSPDRAARLLDGLTGESSGQQEDQDRQPGTGSDGTSGKGRSDG